MYRYSFIIIMLLVSSLLSAQNNYTPTNLVKGCPVQLRGINYFSDINKFSYALLKSDNGNTDLLYFFVERVNPDSNNFILVQVLNNVIAGYSYLKMEKIDSLKLHMTGNIDMRYGTTLNADLFYFPNENKVLFRFSNIHKGITAGIKLPINFELGIRDELILMFTNLYNYQSNTGSSDIQYFPFPMNFHLSAGLRFLDHYKIDFRIGIMLIYEDFYGIDDGIFVQTDLFNTRLYATAGIDFINNGGDAHGTMVYSESGGKTTFYCIGFGYRASKHFNVDMMYYIPNEKVFGFNNVVATDYAPGGRYDKIDNGVLKFGVQYSFIF